MHDYYNLYTGNIYSSWLYNFLSIVIINRLLLYFLCYTGKGPILCAVAFHLQRDIVLVFTTESFFRKQAKMLPFFCGVYMKIVINFILVPLVTETEFMCHDGLSCHFCYSVDVKTF
jgi:hypothetical protein